MFRHFMWSNAIMNALALILVACGMVVGSVFQNSIMVTVLSATGVIVKGWNEYKKYSSKMEMSRFAYSTHEKLLIELRGYANGLPMEDMECFLSRIKTMEETISDLAPLIRDSFVRKYDKSTNA